MSALLFAGLAAADQILDAILPVPLAKALNPLDEDDFQIIVKQLQENMWSMAGPVHKSALERALYALDVDWGKQPIAAGRRVVRVANEIFAKAIKDLPMPALEKEIVIRVKGTTVASIKEYRKKFKLSGTVDATKVIPEKSAKAASTNFGNYVRNANGDIAKGASEAARKIVEAGIKEGVTNKELSLRLRSSLEVSYINRSKAYYDMVAGVHLNRSRTYAALGSCAAGGVKEFEFVAVRDEVTTPQCRLMHGKRFPVAGALAKMNATAAGADPREETPWIQESPKELYYKKNGERVVVATIDKSGYGKVDDPGKFSNVMSDAKLAAIGINIPPIHGHCRSTIVPVAGPRKPMPTMADLSILDDIDEADEADLLREDAEAGGEGAADD